MKKEKMSEENPLISIIVPVYNVEKYLEQCVGSLINQTYKNIEIILVDDGSKDSSGVICDKYAAADARVVVLHKPNEGVSETRNKGIELAHGEYVMFVDSDDWIDVDMCKILLDAIQAYGVKSAMCSYVREYPGKSIPKILGTENKVFTGQDFRRRICGPMKQELKRPENLDSYGSVCGKIYPIDALIRHRFEKLQKIGTAEDVLFNFVVFADIENIVCLDLPLYHYRKMVQNSITSGYKSDLADKWKNLYAEFYESIDYEKMGDVFLTALNNRIAINTLGLGFNSIHHNVSVFEKCRGIKRVLNDNERQKSLKQLDIKYMPIHWKVFFLLAKLRFSFLLAIMLTVMKRMKGKV